MSKRCLLVNPSISTVSQSPPCLTNWDLCIICQINSKEKLQCPAESKRKDVGVGYVTFVQILSTGALPNSQALISRLDEGDGMLLTLNSHAAKWHKSCRSYYCQREIDRESDREAKRPKLECVETSSDTLSPIKRRDTRLLTGALTNSGTHLAPEVKLPVCFLCGGPAEYQSVLHWALEKKVNEKVRDCAEKLKDVRLLALFEIGGDLKSKNQRYHARCLAGLYN